MIRNSTWAPSRPERAFRIGVGEAGLLPIMVSLLIAVLVIFEPRFATVQNAINILRNASFLMIVAVGQMLVMIVGGLDMSIGATMALTSVASVLVMTAVAGALPDAPNLAILTGIAAGLGCGLAVGVINGLCVALMRVPPFMVTLGMASVVGGVALMLTSGVPVYGLPQPFIDEVGRALWLGLPTAFYVALAIVVGLALGLRFTRPGVRTLAVGGNRQAAAVSGVPTGVYLLGAYVACSLLAAVASLLLTAQIGSGQGAIGDQLTLESIAAAVIAGVSLRGGAGRPELVALGAIFLLVLTNAMDLMQVDSKIQSIWLGAFVVLAVVLEALGRGVSRRG
jgi:ribose transport system permease protein